MGDSKLCLSLLLTILALTYAQEERSTCLINTRYQVNNKYEYMYNAESLNAINGASNLRNGPRVMCKVEIEVPQTCSFIVRTIGCVMEEVVGVNAEGEPVFAPAAGSEAFTAEMERYPLKVVVEGVYDVKLYPEEGETTTILNIKRGIISALAVPLEEKEKNKNMPTIHGKCKTHYNVNSRDDAAEVDLTRDLSKCDRFVPTRDHVSPLALISGVHYPLSKLIGSTQTCKYKFHNEKKHMMSGSCTEKHILIPFSHKGEYGVTNVGKQELMLVQITPYDNEDFQRGGIVKGLHMEIVEDKSVIQDKDTGLKLLGELAVLPETEGDRRAYLFQKLVTMVRGMKYETLSPAIPKALAVSRVLTYQVLAQCGTPECSSAIMQIFRTLDTSSLEVDAGVFAMGLVSNPSPLLINDMLEMAKYKPSKPIMYALSNVVKRYYKSEEKLIPEIYSVAEFMAARLGDCTGDQDTTFMTLRVIGNMAAAVGPASPALRAAVIQCVNKPEASLAVQQAAIQAYRLTPVPEEGREVLMQVLLDGASPMQKRIAAYLVLMKDPRLTELEQLAAALPIEQDQQVKSFVISHVTNILSSTEPETLELRQKILNALQGNEIGPMMDPTKFSGNYKIGSVEGNMLFEGTSYLPKEVMLEMTLKAFGYDTDMMEIGMQGKGFEPTIDALFGEDGFFPDTVLKTMYFVSDNMPTKINEILRNVMPALKRDRMKRQAPQNLMRDIGRNINKLVRELKTAESPEAMVYLRLLGNELGYLKTDEITDMAYSAALMIDNMFKMFPTDLMKALMTKTDNTIFAHYIFMDNEFSLPTATGVPLRIALSGTFTPGIKGGLKIAPDMSEVSFMPSAGIEFDTHIGSFIPEYVNSGLEMHTSIFHESGLSAKISMARDNIKLTIPAPTSPTKVIKMTNTLVAVSGSAEMMIPPAVTDKVDVSECTLFFTGMKYCTSLQYIDAFHEETPYFPFTGDSKFAIELHPTGEVTEYTATLSYELLREGEEGRQKVDSVKAVLKAEGAEPTEAAAILKYNRRKNVLTADIQIPDYDVEAGLRLGVVDGNTKGKGTHSISLDLINKNIPQLSLVGRAKLLAMKDAMLQVQLLVPSISADATVTTNLKRDEDIELALKSQITVMDATSEQKITMRYGARKMEVELKSDVNSDTTGISHYADYIKKYGNDILELQVGETEKTVSEMLKEFMKAVNNHMEVYAADIPYIQNFRVPDMPEISLPEKLFLNTEAKAVYYFNNERFTISLPLPLGGKSTEDLNFPPALTTPAISLPQFGLEIVSVEIPIPELFVPESFTLAIPLFGKAEVSALMKSNLYNMEASVAAGKDVVETPSYSAKFDVTGTSPIDVLSVNLKGSGMLATTETIKAQLKGSLAHKFIEASVDILEDAIIADKINLRSSFKVDATSPLGVKIALEHTGMAGVNTEEISADSDLEGTVTVGPMNGKAIATQTFAIFPLKPEAKIDSSVQIDSTLVKAQNTIAASLANGELSVMSNTNAFEDTLTHVAELSFKDSKLSLKSDANAMPLGIKVRNQAEASAGAGEVLLRMETNADYSENRVYSLQTASLNTNGLTVNSDATIKILENEATHKATLTMNKDGLTTSGSNTLQSPLTLENTFNAGLDAAQASLSITNKAVLSDIKVDNANTLTITPASLDFSSTAEAAAGEYAAYTHDITVALKDYTATANVNNNLKLLEANLINEAKLQAELYKIDLTGSLKAVYGEEEIKHLYEVNYADMAALAKCSTTGKLLGTHMNQNTEIEVIGLAARIANDARFNSQPMRYDHTIRASVVPFDFNLDAIVNADGDMTMYGKHSAQLYGKLLLKAQPLGLASSHEWRASLNQQLDNGFTLETTLDNSMVNVLSLQEQKSSFRLKSKVNDHIFNQDLSIYNTAERTGIEVSSNILTNILNSESTENQEFGISGFFKYDKSTDSHVIQIPLIDLPDLLENIKGFFLSAGEALQSFINNEEVKARLQAIPKHVEDFVTQLNIEERVIQLQQYLSDFTQEYMISMEDVEATLRNLKETVEKLLSDLRAYAKHFAGVIKEVIVSGTLPETLIQTVQQQWVAFNEQYDIKAILVYVIDAIAEMVQQTDLEKLKDSSIAFLNDLEAQYEIKAKLQGIMSYLKERTEAFDMEVFLADLKNYISSIDLRAHVDELVSQIPTEMLINMKDYIRDVIQNLDIVGKINTFYANIGELIVKFEVDKKVQVIFDKVVELIKQFKVDESIRALAKMLIDADIPAKVMQVVQGTIDYLKTTEFKDIIAEFNVYIHVIEQKLNSFDYNDFVARANQMTAEYTSVVNDLIVSLEIQKKLEASRDFAIFVLTSIRDTLEQLKEIKMMELLQNAKDIFDKFVLTYLKEFAEIIKQEIENLDINAKIDSSFQFARKFYTDFITTATDMLTSAAEMIKRVAPQPKIVEEIWQIIEGLITGLKNAEFNMPSFTIPLTDLVVPSMKFSIDNLYQFEVPQRLDIPEFTIMGFHTVQAISISIDDIKQRLTELIDYLLNCQMKMLDMGASYGDMILIYIPSLPEFSLPEITVPEFSIPTLPQVQAEKLTETLTLPPFKLPEIPSEIMIPGFGKLSSEVKINTPIYSIKNAAELQRSLDVDTPQLTAFLTSQGTSISYDILNFNLDSTARIAVPEGRLIAAETFKFTHSFLMVDHDVSMTFSDFTAQVSAKTTIKSTTEPYNAELVNEAFLATNGGLSATMDTSYKHVLNLPIIDLTGETSVTQKAAARQEGTSITLTLGNQGTATLNSKENSHKSDLQVTVNPRSIKFNFNSDTDTFLLKLKQTLSADSVIFSYFKFDIRSDVEGPALINNHLMGEVTANMHDTKLEFKATHSTDLSGKVSGVLNNVIDVVLSPKELVFSLQNKGNTKFSLYDALAVKIDLQNDYSATFRPDTQHMNTVALARLNQYKVFCSLTAHNNEQEAAILAAVEGEANLDFLTRPISIPEINIPFVDLNTPAISDLNLYEETGLKNILTTTEQTVNVEAKVALKKSQAAPLADIMGLIQIPSVDNLITELSFKSAIINLNVNAGLFAEADLVFRLSATTASVFESLKAKLDGTTSLSMRRGIMLANSLSLENQHFEGSHHNTISLGPETLGTAFSVKTEAKISLPVLKLEGKQNLVADTNTKPTALSYFRIMGDFDIPSIKAVGKAKIDHSVKLDGSFEFVSMESSTVANVDSTILEDCLVQGSLDSEINLYLNNNGLRSVSKVIADSKLNYGETKIISTDINENLEIEASLSRVYTMLKYNGNNEANVFNFNTNGRHNLQTTIDFTPSSLTTNIEIEISQPSNLGDLSLFEKTVAEVKAAKQKVSTNAKFVSPLYTTTLAAELDGSTPVFKADLKSSATSAITFLDYDFDSSVTLTFEDEGIKLTGRGIFTHSDVTMDIQQILSHTLSKDKVQIKLPLFSSLSSESRLTFNVDVTSPAFTDMNVRYAVRKDGISSTISIPSTGFLGLQLHGRIPSQMNARLYGRYASDPGRDVDIFTIRASIKDTDRMKLKMLINTEAPDIMLSGLQERLPAITSSLSSFADKYHLSTHAAQLKNIVIYYTGEAYNIANNHTPDMSQVSILFRNTIVQYQRTAQVFLDAIINFLRETRVKLPGSEEMTPLIEVLNKMTTSITYWLEKALILMADNADSAFNVVMGTISKIQVKMPIGDVMANAKIFDEIRERVRTFTELVMDRLRNPESLDIYLLNLGDTLKFFVEKAQDFVDNTFKSDYLDAIAVYINAFYEETAKLMKTITEYANTALDVEFLKSTIDYILDVVRSTVNQINKTISDYLQQAPAQLQFYAKVKNGKLEINL
ncbi:apolipoprotein B-100-like [Cheilinus undulatus]|uniref:apolipoprotein B-100-like n=1 Tax=Cheilinus undulatus TaxID=241271 RepID=UPI001BD1DA43|nr:apolipoprotein B-100-like [Cheilinus undulatus]